MSNAVRNSRLEKGLKFDVYMFLIFFDYFQILYFKKHFSLEVGDTIDGCSRRTDPDGVK